MTTRIIAYSYYKGYVHYFKNLIRKISCVFPNCEVVIVENETKDCWDEVGWLERTPVTVISHDNRNWEFGAYQRGVDFVRNLHKSDDTIVIVNDTTGIHSLLTPNILRRMGSMAVVASGSSRPTVIGEIDEWRSSISIRGMRANRWVRSCLFSLNTPALEALKWKVCDEAVEHMVRIVGEGYECVDFNSIGLASHLNDWLRKFGVHQGLERKNFASDDDYALRLKLKAEAIINEKLISAKLVAAKGEMVQMVPECGLQRIGYRLRRKMHLKRPAIRRLYEERQLKKRS